MRVFLAFCVIQSWANGLWQATRRFQSPLAIRKSYSSQTRPCMPHLMSEGEGSSSSSPGTSTDPDLIQAFKVLDQYNTEYLSRMKSGRKEGLSPQAVEFRRIQQLGSHAIKKERETLRDAALQVSVSAEEVVLGIMTESVANGINTLKKYVTGLNLQRGVLRAVDDTNDEVPIDSLQDAPVYLKYNSSDNGDVYMKPYDGNFVGVILQPRLHGEEFRQWGDLPLMLF